MLVLTFQQKRIANRICSGEYRVDLNRSNFAYESLRFTMGYKKVLTALKSKGIGLLQDEGCIWGWAGNPSREVIRRYMNMGYVPIFIEVDESKCVFTDYDRFTDYLLGDSEDSRFILEDYKSAGKNTCVQVSFTIDGVYSVQAVFDASYFVVFNSIVRSYYTMLTVAGIKGSIVYSRFIYPLHRVKYLIAKYSYAFRRARSDLATGIGGFSMVRQV